MLGQSNNEQFFTSETLPPLHVLSSGMKADG